MVRATGTQIAAAGTEFRHVPTDSNQLTTSGAKSFAGQLSPLDTMAGRQAFTLTVNIHVKLLLFTGGESETLIRH